MKYSLHSFIYAAYMFGAAIKCSDVLLSVQDIFACIILVLWLFCSNIFCNAVGMKSELVDVLDFGAVGNGKADSSEAFLKAWNFVCSRETESVRLIVPGKHTFLLHPVTFSGQCKAREIKFLIHGTIVSPVSPKAWEGLDQGKWLTFYGVSGLKVKGTGEINGRGWGWWNQSCRNHPGLEGCTSLAPTAITFQSCKTSSLSELRIINSSQTHVLIEGSDHFIVKDVIITAPETSPNTDGIHISSASNIVIRNSRIGTGDDCVSIGDHTTNIDISRVKCGPGHGISIGSLGRAGNFVQVQNIRVSRVAFKGTANGARIKTWQVGRGYVRGVTFENLFFNSVKNPIIIDQNYCNVRGACKELPTGVHIRDVTYRNLWGTSSTHVGITMNCSQSVSCTGLLLQSIWLKSAMAGKRVISSCINAHGAAIGVVQPAPCFQD
ncbi:PREDICTED: probable polygalacturonase At1g80170 isoform X1 [Theobroma cacao]|uniref:Probable polygalacturonase At1g80170 isoform X1 n=2 Tax=Theobroma cacao TaxID=3641 RepID=A0AB32WYJ4_THECC|nr:PREDICTED: probable polygalacturonase At1g80170 isoform X1 [Theobroma cacao]